jgi:glycosyltransferase involved in cell wall biosynthesis
MRNNEKVLFIAGTEFLRGYSGTLYLINALINNGFDPTVYVRCHSDRKEEYDELPFRCYPIELERFSNQLVNKLISAIFRFNLILQSIFFKNVIITEHLYLREAELAKLLNRKIKIVQYCQEIHIPTEEPDNPSAHFYARFAHVPDVVIDVEPNRARIRQRIFGLKNKPLVLANTLPTSALPTRSPKGNLEKLANTILPNNVPLALYIGGVGKEKPPERIIDLISLAKYPVYLLVFCNASEDHIRRLSHYAKDKLPSGNYRICPSIKRQVLLSSIWEADIGLIDYTYSVLPGSSQKYCAPTKLYEYMASGLVILGSNNDSLRNIIEKEEIGHCAENDTVSSMANALNLLLGDILKLKEKKTRSELIFRKKYCYELLCKSELEKLFDYFKSQ